jgi:RNA polymerase sigma-70 factor (ECF subfamily)
MQAAAAMPSVMEDSAARSGIVLKGGVTYEQIYDQSFDFVWRNARRLGVADGAIDDVVQDVFIIAHRRLPEFEARSSIRTWLFGILLKVAKDHRRSEKRRMVREQTSAELSVLDSDEADSPADSVEKKEAAALVMRLLDSLDDDKRAIFVCVELEQMTVAEVAEAVGLNLNTAHARLRSARQAFEQALARHHAAQGFRSRRGA